MQEKRPPGRPLKGKTRRIPITVHLSEENLDKLDEYINMEKSAGRKISRSEFVDSAVKDKLKKKGDNPGR